MSSFPATIPELTAEAAHRWPDRPAITCELGNGTITFSELERRSTAIAGALVKRGVKPGDVVAVMLPNRLEFPLLWLAIIKAGAAMAPINVRYRDSDRNHILSHSGAVAFIAEGDNLRTLAGAHSLPPGLAWSADIETLVNEAAHSSQPELPLVMAHTTANIQYTSGTTGMPKGCVLSNNYWIRFGECFLRSGPRLTPEDRVLTAQPFSYADPQWNVIAALQSGASLTILEKFSPSRFWQQVCESQTTFFYCLGAMPSLMLQVPPSSFERDHKVRQVLCSGIPRDRHKELESRFACPWFEAFGTTETGGDLIVGPEEHDAALGTGAIGKPVPTKEARALGADGRPVKQGEVGQLAIRGLGMMDGYHSDPAATANAFMAGFYMTGDLVRQDNAGVFYYVGRTKDMIRRGGENIAAAEVEAAIESHPGVALAACIPVPDDIRGEEVKVFILFKKSAKRQQPSMGELHEFVSQRIARFKVPRYWEAVEALPMTPSERVEKATLRANEPTPPRGEDFADTAQMTKSATAPEK